MSECPHCGYEVSCYMRHIPYFRWGGYCETWIDTLAGPQLLSITEWTRNHG